jgi:hypothetical protein
MTALQVGNDGYDGGLSAAILDQHALGSCAVGCAVAPIEFDELLGDRSERQFKLAAVIAAELDGEIRDGNQQGVFVSGDELAFGQQTLDVPEEGDLLRRCWG